MSKLKQALLIAAMVLLGAYVAIPMVKDEMQRRRYSELHELYNSTGYDYLYYESSNEEDYIMDVGIYADGDGYGIVTACLPAEGEKELLRSPMFPAETGTEHIRFWYGICGTKANPKLLLLLDEDEPLCREMELNGADHRSLTYLQDQYRVDTMLVDLPGLPDSENNLTVSLYTAEDVDLELDFGYNFVEKSASDVVETSEEFQDAKNLYFEFTINLTEALARTGW